MIGAAPVGVTVKPVSDRAADIEAARNYMFSIQKKIAGTIPGLLIP